jgi:hypothetical protein
MSGGWSNRLGAVRAWVIVGVLVAAGLVWLVSR